MTNKNPTTEGNQPTSLEQEALTRIATFAASQVNAPSVAELTAAFRALGTWYSSQPASPERDEKAIELATVLVRDYPSSFVELLHAGSVDDPFVKECAELLHSGAVTSQTTFAELAHIMGTVTCQS